MLTNTSFSSSRPRQTFIDQMVFIADVSEEYADAAFYTLDNRTDCNIRRAQDYCDRFNIEHKAKTTAQIQQWLIESDDNVKQLFMINYKIPHNWFNLLCRYFDPRLLQGVDTYKLFKCCNLGHWAHGGKAGHHTEI